MVVRDSPCDAFFGDDFSGRSRSMDADPDTSSKPTPLTNQEPLSASSALTDVDEVPRPHPRTLLDLHRQLRLGGVLPVVQARARVEVEHRQFTTGADIRQHTVNARRPRRQPGRVVLPRPPRVPT